MNKFLISLEESITDARLISAGDIVLVGVSGGADSIALLVGLYKIASDLEFTLVVAHLNHGLRGKDAEGDAEFVESLCSEFGIRFFGVKVDVSARAADAGISLEMAARAERYEFFGRAANYFGTNLVATAHTADDQAETVLLKLARGAGLDGLSGIANKSLRDGLSLVRPFLGISRKQLVKFLDEENQSWREDISNNDKSFMRNRVRHELLPWLKNNLNGSIKETLCRTADVLRDETIWLDEICRKLLDKYSDKDRLNTEELQKEPIAARRRVLRLWLSTCGVSIDEISFQLVKRADELLCRNSSGCCSIQLFAGLLLTRQYDKLLLESGADKSDNNSFYAETRVPFDIVVPEVSLRISAEISTGIIKKNMGALGEFPAMGSISLSAVSNKSLSVRSWRAGDRMKPLGINGSQKLQDIFVNEKVPAKERLFIPVVECGGEIIWIPNFRVARGWDVRSDDEQSVHLYVERI